MYRFSISSNSSWYLRAIIALKSSKERNNFKDFPRFLSKIHISFLTKISGVAPSSEKNYSRRLDVKQVNDLVKAQYLPSFWGVVKYFVASDTQKRSISQRILLELYYLLIAKHFVSGGYLLHASAVMSTDRVILFVGAAGTGKTSVVEYLHQQNNFEILTDNLTILNQNSNLVWINPDEELIDKGELGLNLSIKEITDVIFLERTSEDLRFTELSNNEARIYWHKSFDCSELDYCLQMQTLNSVHPSFQKSDFQNTRMYRCLIPVGKIEHGVRLVSDEILS